MLSLSGITILGTLIIGYVDSSVGLFLGMTLSGIGSLGIYPVGYVFIADITPQKYRGSAYSLRSLVNGLGQAVVAAYSVIIGIHFGIYKLIRAYILSLAAFTILYEIIGYNIPPSPEWVAPDIRKLPELLRENEVDKSLYAFALFYAIPRGAMQIRAITYFVESRGVTETMGSVLLGVIAAPAVLSVPILMLVDFFYREDRLRIRPLAASVAILLFMYLFHEFFSRDYKRSYKKTENVAEALILIFKKLSEDRIFRGIILIGGIAFMIAGTVGPLKNGILADTNLPEYRGFLYATLSVIDSLGRGIGAAIAGFLGEEYSLKLALSFSPLLRLPSAFIMLYIALIANREYKEVKDIIISRNSGTS